MCRDMKVSSRRYTFENLAFFLTHHIDSRHKSSTIPSVLSALRKAGEWQHPPLRWLSNSQSRALSDFRRAILKENPVIVHRKQPLSIRLLDQIELVVTADPFVNGPMFFVMAFLAHDGLLRFKELANLRVRDVLWDEASSDLWLCIRQSKANQTGPPEVQAVCSYRRICGATLLAAYWRANRLHLATGSDFLFATNPQARHVPVASAAFTSWLRRVLRSIGVRRPNLFSGHSMRIGGVCDAWDAQLPPEVIRVGGRWKSAAWRLYLRTRPRRVGHCIAMGFRRLARR